MAYNGQPMVTSIGVVGKPRQLPNGYQTYDRAGAVKDLVRPLKVAVTSISIVAVLLWVVAALIVGSVVYLSALERVRDFAVFKAIGTRSRSIMAGLALQALDRRAARGGAGRHPCAAVGADVPDDRRGARAVPTCCYRRLRSRSACWPASPDCGGWWPWIRRSRSEVPERWAI